MDNVITENLTEEQLDQFIDEFFSDNSNPQPVIEVVENPPIEPPEDPITITLPVNSPTILLGEETSRFSAAEWYGIIRGMDVTIAGLGGIGSYTAFLVGRMHPRTISLYDGDIVEQANMSGQLYGVNNVGIRKSSSTADIIKEFSNYYSSSTYSMLTADSPISPVLLCGFDNMNARMIAFSAWKHRVEECQKEYRKDFLFIDGRLAAEEFQVFCMTGDDAYLIDKYNNEWLFPDSEAEETVCSYKQTSYCANMIASVMVNLLVNYAANKVNHLFPRELPFMTRYDASTMIFKTE